MRTHSRTAALPHCLFQADVTPPLYLQCRRVDLCLFCLQPHRLRPVDLRFMLELGKVVPILPIVTKADTMTIREASTYRQEVHAKFQNCYIPGVRGMTCNCLWQLYAAAEIT